MIAYPDMLVEPAKRANIQVPDDPDNYDKELYIRWHIFIIIQIGAPMPTPTAHWENAKVIAQIPEDKLKTISLDELEEMGLQLGKSY